jgi:hypothetical protein
MRVLKELQGSQKIPKGYYRCYIKPIEEAIQIILKLGVI